MDINIHNENYQNYQKYRDQFDNVIHNAVKEINKNDCFKNLVLSRTKITYYLIHEWIEKCTRLIPSMGKSLSHTSDLEELLTKTYYEYITYVVNYRILHGNIDNILFSKIISLEIYFFNRKNIFQITEELYINENNFHTTLFQYNPLGHFMYYKIQKEYSLSRSRSDISFQEAVKLQSDLLTLLLDSLTKFFKNKKHDIEPFDFYNFTNKPEQKSLQLVLQRISDRHSFD